MFNDYFTEEDQWDSCPGCGERFRTLTESESVDFTNHVENCGSVSYTRYLKCGGCGIMVDSWSEEEMKFAADHDCNCNEGTTLPCRCETLSAEEIFRRLNTDPF